MTEQVILSLSSVILAYDFLFSGIFVWFWYQGDGWDFPRSLTHHPWVGPAACQAGPPGWILALDLEASAVGLSGIIHGQFFSLLTLGWL